MSDASEYGVQHLVETVGSGAEMVVEVGAAFGDETVLLRGSFPDAEIHCFEPDLRACDELVLRFAKEIPVNRFLAAPCAIGDRTGSTTYWRAVDENDAAFGSIRKPTGLLRAVPDLEFVSTLNTVIRLDHWLRYQLPTRKIDLIVVKANGAQRDVILGAKVTLGRTKHILIDFHDPELYAGEATLAELEDLLPDWELVDVDTRALFANKELRKLTFVGDFV